MQHLTVAERNVPSSAGHAPSDPFHIIAHSSTARLALGALEQKQQIVYSKLTFVMNLSCCNEHSAQHSCHWPGNDLVRSRCRINAACAPARYGATDEGGGPVPSAMLRRFFPAGNAVDG